MSEDESYMPIYAWRRTKLDTHEAPTDSDGWALTEIEKSGVCEKNSTDRCKASGNGVGRADAPAIGCCHTPDMNPKAKKLCAG